MKTYFIEAYDKQDRPILGNGEGQAVISAIQYKRTQAYKALRDIGKHFPRVKYYLITTPKESNQYSECSTLERIDILHCD